MSPIAVRASGPPSAPSAPSGRGPLEAVDAGAPVTRRGGDTAGPLRGALTHRTQRAELEGLAARRLAEHAQTSAAAFGVRGAVAPASPAQLEAARAEGLALADGEIALAVGGGRGGAAVVAFAPHALFEPIVLNRSDGAREADFVARREVTPARGYVIAEPTEPFAKLKSWEGRALQAAGLVFVDADVTARRARNAAFGAQIEGYAAALAQAELAPPARLQASTTLATLRSLHETTGGMLEG